MKFFALTIFALISTGLALPVKNLDNDVHIEQINKLEQESYFTSISSKVSKESKLIAQFFVENLPKLQKIRDGLKADGNERASLFVAKAINIVKPYADENFVVGKISPAKYYVLGVINIIRVNKKYLEEEKSVENLLDALIQSEDNEAHFVSVFADVDEESKKIAKFFEDTIPKLEELSEKIKRTNEPIGLFLSKIIDSYRPFKNPLVVSKNKNKAKLYAIGAMITLKLAEKYTGKNLEIFENIMDVIPLENYQETLTIDH